MSFESPRRPLKLVLIDSHEKTAETIKEHFTDKGVRLVGEAGDLKAGLRLVRGLLPDVVLLEMPAEAEQALEAVQRIRAELPECGIIISSNEVSPDLILSTMRAGAQEFVSRPVAVEDLEKAIEHLRRLLGTTPPSSRRRSNTIALFPTKGGVGTSLLAANLAVALAQRPETRVALVDLNFQMGDLSLMLDLKPRYTLADLHGSSSIDEGAVRSMLASHSSGVMFLAAASYAEDGHKVERNHMIETFGVLNTMFDYVIVDTDRHLDERTLEVLDLSDRVLLVATLSLPSVRNAKRYHELFRRLEMDNHKFELVVNRYNNKKSGLRIRDMEGAVGIDVSWLVPNDYQVANHSIDAGVPLVLGATKSKLAKSFEEHAEKLVAAVESHAEADSAITTPASVE
jgi:pilus assembly protein CpaE